MDCDGVGGSLILEAVASGSETHDNVIELWISTLVVNSFELDISVKLFVEL